jgi:predicted Rossmann fold flavoprotein
MEIRFGISLNMIFDLIVVGGGASGFFGAIQAASIRPEFKILILEKSNKVLSKVKVSGGGRCNVTHQCFDPIALAKHYPRGQKALKQLFKNFGAQETVLWFAQKGVDLHAEDDGRIFPNTNSSQTIIDCFVQSTIDLGIKMESSTGVNEILKREDLFEICTLTGKKYYSRKVLIAVGGNSNSEFYDWIRKLGHTIVPPIPSLFTFNDSCKEFSSLMGIAVPQASIKIASTKFEQAGPILITHWGLSGPAVIKLSAWAAEYLFSKNYIFTVLVCWLSTDDESQVRGWLQQYRETKGKQRVMGNPLFNIPQRLWEKLCEKAEISPMKIWSEVSNKNLNKLLELLIRCPFEIKGKTTFKEEFVTCGGVDLQEIDLRSMESKKVNDLFFAGEVLHIDGETGGFNFQVAWTTSYVAARKICS